MTQEDKDLLIKDLCGRLPYGVKVLIQDITGNYRTITERVLDTYVIQFINNIIIKPYLRPMSSMTEEEKKEYKHLVAFSGSSYGAANFIDWFNAHHFDYRDLIPMGLALEAKEGMYN